MTVTIGTVAVVVQIAAGIFLWLKVLRLPWENKVPTETEPSS